MEKKKIIRMDFEFESDICPIESELVELFAKKGQGFVDLMKGKGTEITCNVYATFKEDKT